MSAPTSILDEHRFTACQVADASITKPTALGVDINPLGDGELGAGLLDIAAKCQWIRRNLGRVHHLPAIHTQQIQILGVAWMNLQGDLKRLARLFGQLTELTKFVNLETISLSFKFDGAIRTSPTGYRGETVAYTFRGHGPILQNHRLPHRTPTNIPRRNGANRTTDVFSDGEIRIMPLQAQPGVAACVPELCEARINIYVSFATQATQERLES